MAGVGLLAGWMAIGWVCAGEAPEPLFPEYRSSLAPLMPLDDGWAEPPRIAQTRCWWWWLNGNTTREAITRELEAMKAIGLGGANVIDAGGADQRGNRQVPHGPDFASPAWRELFTHAMAEADRLGLEMGFNILSGWNLGGPFVTPEFASKMATFSEATVIGGQRVDLGLPAPSSRDGFYRDVAVVAFPLPVSGPQPVAHEASSSSAQATHPASLAVDGDAETFWVSGSDQPGQGPQPDRPEWLELQFERPVTADRLELHPRPEYGPRRCRLEVRNADGHYAAVASLSPPATGAHTVSFDPVESDRFRLIILDSHDPRNPDQPRNTQVAELGLFHGSSPLLPAGDDQLPRIHNAGQKAYFQYPGAFNAAPAWHLMDVEGDPTEAACRLEDVVDLSSLMDPAGRLQWDAPAGAWRVLRFGYTLQGAEVSTHSQGWDGPCVDYLDPDAFAYYWQKVVVPILDEVRPYLGRSLRFLHTDSWELGPVNWTPRLPEEFARRRGYDVTPWLPAMAGYVVDNRDASTRFLNDFRRTLADLIADNKYGAFAAHAHAVGAGIHPESGGPHAGPFDALQNLGRSDLPMGEFWARNTSHRVEDTYRLFVKQTSSAAHIYGKRVALAEAFTTIGPHWERDPRMLKPTFDRVACEGHNLTMWHTFDTSPAEMGIPGQAYFAGTHLNPNVTWWPESAAFIAYMNRCHFLLQQGVPVSDVLYFYGENIPAFARLKRDDPAGVLPGYDYDVINREALLSRVTVTDGRLALPEGTQYRLLVLPAHPAVSLDTLRQVATMVEAGAILVGERPARRYDLAGYRAGDREFAALVETLWGRQSKASHRLGKGRVFPAPTAREALADLGIEPDFTYSGGNDDAFLDYIHRRTDHADIYFVVNRNEQLEQLTVSFRIAGRLPELWDPVTGLTRDAPAFRQRDGRTEIPLELAPNGSTFVVFRRATDQDRVGDPDRLFPTRQAVQQLTGPWTVKFEAGWGPEAPVTFPTLTSWTEHDDPEVKFFSGHAAYSLQFDCDAAGAETLWLDLGEVRNLARVRLNGVDLGVVWTDPFRVDISRLIRPHANELEVTVVNLWPNRLIGDQLLPADQRRTRTNVVKFERQQELLPSGLLGPVTILSETAPP